MMRFWVKTGQVLFLLVFLFTTGFSPLALRPVMAQSGGAVVSVRVIQQGPISVGQAVDVEVRIDTVPQTRAASFKLAFNPQVLECKTPSHDAGGFYADWAAARADEGGWAMIFPTGGCDNPNGMVKEWGITIMGAENSGGPSGSGVIAVVHFTAKANGISPLTLQGVVVSDANAQTLQNITLQSGQVVVGPTPSPTLTSTATPTATQPTRTPTATSATVNPPPPSGCERADVNGDGVVNIADIAAVGMRYGETGQPGWIPEDVNMDGIINVSDVAYISNLCMDVVLEKTSTPTVTATTGSNTATFTATPSPTATSPFTPPPSYTATQTLTSTQTATTDPNATQTPTSTETLTPGAPTFTRTVTPTRTRTGTPTGTPLAVMRLQPPANVGVGDTFDLQVMIDATIMTRAGQFNLEFDKDALECVKISEGTFFKSWAQANGASTLPNPGGARCDNTNGRLTTAGWGVSIMGGPAEGPTGSGVMALVQFKAKKAGNTDVDLFNVFITDVTGKDIVPIRVEGGQVSVGDGGGAATATTTATRTSTATVQNNPSNTRTPTRTSTTAGGGGISTRTPTRTATYPPGYTPPTGLTSIPSATPRPTVPSTSRMAFNPAAATATVGETFTVEVVLKDVDKSSRSAQAAIQFDPAVLECLSVEEGTFYSAWADSNGGSTLFYPEPKIDNAAGKVSTTGVTIMLATTETHGGGPTGSGVFLKIKFKAKANGTATLKLSDVVVSDDRDTLTNSLAVVVEQGQVFVGTTPTPSQGGGSSGSRTGTPTLQYTLSSSNKTGTAVVEATKGTSTPSPTAGVKAAEDAKVLIAVTGGEGEEGELGVATIDFSDLVGDDGIVLEKIELRSPDGLVVLRIDRGVQALTADNYPLRKLSFRSVPPPLPDPGKNRVIIGTGYEIEPNGVTFDPPAHLLIAYDRGAIPKGYKEKDFVIAVYDPEKEKWVELKSKVTKDEGAVHTEISHLSLYAVMGRKGMVNWVLVGVLALLTEAGAGAAVFVYLRRRRSVQAQEEEAPVSVLLIDDGQVVDAQLEPLGEDREVEALETTRHASDEMPLQHDDAALSDDDTQIPGLIEN